ncbi:MAG: hypothetical protein AAFY99_15065, partial [Pseudomonadota bacterium]
FQFDGQRVQLKNATLSNAWRKLNKRVHGWAKSYVKRYRNRGDSWLRDNASLQDKATEALRVLTAPQSTDMDYRDWTFMSYVRRCERTFSSYSNNFNGQTLKYRRRVVRLYGEALEDAINRHGAEKFKNAGGQL